jgi:hypothetical protein
LVKTTANELVAEIKATRRDPDNFSSQKTDDDLDFISNINKNFIFEETVNTLRQGVSYQGVSVTATDGLVSTAIIDGRTNIVQVSAVVPYKLSIQSPSSLSNMQDYIYVTSTSGFSGPNVLVTSLYDVNEDGQLDWQDMKLMSDYLLGLDIEPGTTWPNGYPLARMDVNDDGEVTLTDYVQVKAHMPNYDLVSNGSGKQLGIDATGAWVSEDWGETKTYIHTF